jgi:hypothetical protein
VTVRQNGPGHTGRLGGNGLTGFGGEGHQTPPEQSSDEEGPRLHYTRQGWGGGILP